MSQTRLRTTSTHKYTCTCRTINTFSILCAMHFKLAQFINDFFIFVLINLVCLRKNRLFELRVMDVARNGLYSVKAESTLRLPNFTHHRLDFVHICTFYYWIQIYIFGKKHTHFLTSDKCKIPNF